MKYIYISITPYKAMAHSHKFYLACLTCGLHQDFVKTISYRVVGSKFLAINNHIANILLIETKKIKMPKCNFLLL